MILSMRPSVLHIYLDSADLVEIEQWAESVSGITTNPTLVKQAGVFDYKAHAKRILSFGLPTSIEVLSLDAKGCLREALTIAGMGGIPKIPAARHLVPVARALAEQQIVYNLTAICSPAQLAEFATVIQPDTIVSIFAGRIADTGRDPYPFVEQTAATYKTLWASTREVLNIGQARLAGCSIVTVSPALLAKFEKWDGVDLVKAGELTVSQFTADAAGYVL